mmetsp:Transcript_7152/g.11295  ORF Transcript_7152/g.11295 Transcript_7152/m.11295 type:complete len:98 (-) Transcript_7152:835-1128(-)
MYEKGGKSNNRGMVERVFVHGSEGLLQRTTRAGAGHWCCHAGRVAYVCVRIKREEKTAVYLFLRMKNERKENKRGNNGKVMKRAVDGSLRHEEHREE